MLATRRRRRHTAPAPLIRAEVQRPRAAHGVVVSVRYRAHPNATSAAVQEALGVGGGVRLALVCNPRAETLDFRRFPAGGLSVTRGRRRWG